MPSLPNCFFCKIQLFGVTFLSPSIPACAVRNRHFKKVRKTARLYHPHPCGQSLNRVYGSAHRFTSPQPLGAANHCNHATFLWKYHCLIWNTGPFLRRRNVVTIPAPDDGRFFIEKDATSLQLFPFCRN
jgi:hypothetical protein